MRADHITHDILCIFLNESFKPIRITFPAGMNVNYENSIFKCTRNQNRMFFKQTEIETPAIYMAKFLDKVCGEYELEKKDDMYILDTKGEIPTRYVHMLKDFYFKNSATIDYESIVKSNTVRYWRGIVSNCTIFALDRCIKGAIKVANSAYKIRVYEGPPYFKDRLWCTKNGDISKTAEEFMCRSKTLYSLGNIDQKSEIKFGYDKLCKTSGGISMEYAKHLQLDEFISHLVEYKCFVRLDSSLEVRGHDTYDRLNDLSVEEIVILHEFLKSEGANVKVMNGDSKKRSSSYL